MEHAFLAEKSGRGLIKSTLLSFLFSIVFGICLLLTSSAVLLHYQSASAVFRSVGILLPSATAFAGGIVAGKVEKKQGALAGILHGVFFLLSLFLISRIFGNGELSLPLSLILYGVILLLSALGGMLGATKRSKGKKRRKKRR